MNASSPTFFEGPEKKLELVISGAVPSLRRWPAELWQEVVTRAQAQVLSRRQASGCDAYLLSESSLFVFDDRVTMITCGQTRLVDAAQLLIERIGAEHIGFLIYERKNEHFPARQPSTFFDDAQRLQELIPGRAYRFGSEDEHCIHLFHSRGAYRAEPDDTTLEVLMHGIGEAARAHFATSPPAGDSIARRTGLDRILPGFELDEHSFAPGYSLNAVRRAEYFTVHVTPETVGSYVSFETNVDLGDERDACVRALLEVFTPASFDLMAFQPEGGIQVELPGYRLRDRVRQRLECGFDVSFQHFYAPPSRERSALEIPLA